MPRRPARTLQRESEPCMEGLRPLSSTSWYHEGGFLVLYTGSQRLFSGCPPLLSGRLKAFLRRVLVVTARVRWRSGWRATTVKTVWKMTNGPSSQGASRQIRSRATGRPTKLTLTFIPSRFMRIVLLGFHGRTPVPDTNGLDRRLTPFRMRVLDANVFGQAVLSRSRKCFATRIIKACRASAGLWRTQASTNWRSSGNAYPTR
jgi:hypothetical protein